MTDRRKLLTALGASVLADAVAFNRAGAQTPTKVHRVGYIVTAKTDEQAHLTRALEEGLRDLGYVEGRNIVYERRFAEGKPERLPALAAELVRLNLDVIVSGGNPVITALRQVTSTIPVVMSTSRDPVGAGFIASLARPGGNITGLSSEASPEIVAKSLQLLKEAIPKATRVALLWNPAPPSAETYKKVVESAALKLGITLFSVAVRGRDEFDSAFAAMGKERVDGLVVLPDPLTFTARSQIVQLATKHRLPGIYQAREYAELGGLMSYGTNLADQFRRTAAYVDKILKGAKPSDLPVEQAAQYEMVLNMQTAKALGLAIPTTLRLRADHVIE